MTRVVRFNLNSQIDKQFLISVLFPTLDSHFNIECNESFQASDARPCTLGLRAPKVVMRAVRF
jgi:hypothetical protein